MLFAAGNRVIATRLERKLTESPDNPLFFEDKISEFGGCRYLLRCETEPAAVLVCIGFAQDTAREIDTTHDEAIEAVEQHVGSVAQVLPDAPPTYHFAVKVDMAALRAMDADEQQRRIQRIASIRLAVQGGPLRNWLQRWIDGTLDETLVPVYSGPEGHWYCRLGQQNLTAVFPVRLKHFQDPVMLTALLQEFASNHEANGTGIPTSAYITEKGKVPVELEQLPANELADVDGGFMQLTLDKRQCTSDNLDNIVWQLMTCYLVLRYQTQLSKVSLHSQMRQRLSTVAANLEKARRPTFDSS